MDYYRYRTSPWGMPGRMLTPAVKQIIIANCVIFALQLFLFPGRFDMLFGLSMAGVRRLMLWQFVSYMFLHARGHLWHIIFNMLALFFFGPETERAIGTRRFTMLYFVSGIIGGLGWLLVSGTSGGICIGASGAVFGILGAFAALFPKRPITLLVFFVLPVTMQARTMVFGLGLIQLVSLLTLPNGIAYAAHIGGGVAGYLYALALIRTDFGGGRLYLGKWINDLKWKWQRRKFKVIKNNGFSTRNTFSGFTSADEPDPEEVDRILEKISKWGISTLTREEHEILDRASRRR